jgi:hypothetical protein
MADESRPFVINVKRRWLLAILPVLATIYFVAVIVLNILDYRIQGVTTDMLVLGGVGLFVLVMLIELPFFMRRSGPKRARPERARAAAPAATMDAGSNGHGDDEYLITEELQQGLQVLEYSAPAKSRNSNTVYTKTYVPVSQAHVVRVETAVADPTEI